MEKPVVKKDKNNTSISFYTLDNNAETKVRTEIEDIFTNKRLDDFKDIIYTCVKELMVNASKSNIKKTFFVEAKIDENDREIYELAKKNVKKIMTDKYFSYLRTKLQKHNHNVEVNIEDKDSGIIISVKNPNPMLKDEEIKVRKVLKTAMEDENTDLSLYYNDSSEDAEGATLGMILVVNLLRQMNINPALFRIGVINNDTIARIEIPITAAYKSMRQAG
jgi:hypothetical protein